MEQELNKVTKYLKSLAGKEGAASVQINNDGKAILRWDASGQDIMTVEQLAEEVESFNRAGDRAFA